MTSYPSGREVSAAEELQVLIVDADVRVLAALQATIGAEPDLVVAGAVSDLAAAVTIAAGSGPCVALVDVAMRGVHWDSTSVEVLSRVAGCQVVAMGVRSGARSDALEAGAVEFVVKGGDVEEILSAVRNTGASTV